MRLFLLVLAMWTVATLLLAIPIGQWQRRRRRQLTRLHHVEHTTCNTRHDESSRR